MSSQKSSVSELEMNLAIQDTLNEMRELVSKIDIDVLARYNQGYLRYKSDPYGTFILDELPTWKRIIRYFALERSGQAKGILDVGTFIPFYPAVLKRLGFQVAVIEKLDLYTTSFAPIKEYLDMKGIILHNIDIITDSLSAVPTNYDIILSAVLEHLNGSPRLLMERLRLLMNEDSHIFILVPNITHLVNVVSMVFGKTPLPAYCDYYFSSYPFEGHNREMTLDELRQLCQYSGLEVVTARRATNPSFHRSLLDGVFTMIKLLIPAYSQMVFVVAKKSTALPSGSKMPEGHTND